MNNFHYFTILFLITVSFTSSVSSEIDTNSVGVGAVANDQSLRKERAVLFPSASTIGILAAIAVPLNDRKDVFLSYNFEANYNSPFSPWQYIPGPLKRLDLVRSFSSSATKMAQSLTNTSGMESDVNYNDYYEVSGVEQLTVGTESTTRLPVMDKVKRRSLVSRRNLYKIIEKKLDAAGFNGHECLLRTICEAADLPLGLHNGVLGDIMHIVFTPSSSAKESILYDFYDAEIHGTLGMCEHYKTNCPRGIFDMISIFEHRLTD